METTFQQFVEEATAGLQNDHELFLDVSRELYQRLEEKQTALIAEGHDAAESARLACEALGPPAEVSAEMVTANAVRLRRRALARLVIMMLIVPLALLAVLYIGYGRVARIDQWLGKDIEVIDLSIPLKPLPGFALVTPDELNSRFPLLKQLGSGNASDYRKYWEAHRQETDGPVYFAYYMEYADTEDSTRYLHDLQLGERMEPDNAFYPLCRARYYLNKGILPRTEKFHSSREAMPSDDLLDRQAFAQGLVALRTAMNKPYLHTYQTRIRKIVYATLPHPILTEDYLTQYNVFAVDASPQLLRDRSMARKIGGCARILLRKGHPAEAEAVMDLAKPYLRLITDDSDTSIVHALVAQSVGRQLTREAADLYIRVGAVAKAREMRNINDQLKAYQENEVKNNPRKAIGDALVSRQGSMMATLTCPVGIMEPTLGQLKPGRMHEHVLMEELTVDIVMLVLALALLDLLIFGTIVLLIQRRRGIISPLLLPSPGMLLRVLGWGVLTPFAVYWLYSRTPFIGGRELNFHFTQFPRYGIEWGLLALALIILPTMLSRRFIRRRCADLGIDMPSSWREGGITWGIRLLPVAAIACLVFIGKLFGNYSLLLTAICMTVVCALACIAILHIMRLRRQHALFYGTLSLSLVPFYTATLLFLLLVIQPWLVGNEIYWLRKDTAVLNHPSHSQHGIFATGFEEQATETYIGKLKEIYNKL